MGKEQHKGEGHTAGKAGPRRGDLRCRAFCKGSVTVHVRVHFCTCAWELKFGMCAPLTAHMLGRWVKHVRTHMRMHTRTSMYERVHMRKHACTRTRGPLPKRVPL